MACGVSDSFGRVFPNKVYATLEFRACRITVVHPCRDEKSILIAVSTVTGCSVLYPYPPLGTTNCDGYNTNYVMVPWIAFSQGCRERISGLVVIITVYAYIYIIINATVINCWFLLSYAARPFEDASLR